MPGAEGTAAVVTGAAVTGGGEGVQKSVNSRCQSTLCDGVGGMVGAIVVAGGRDGVGEEGGSTSCC